MKKITYYLSIALIFAACNTSQKKSDTTAETGCCSDKETKTEACCSKETKVTEATVDAIFSTPEKFVDQTVNLKGRVIHTCKKSGKKCFWLVPMKVNSFASKLVMTSVVLKKTWKVNWL